MTDNLSDFRLNDHSHSHREEEDEDRERERLRLYSIECVSKFKTCKITISSYKQLPSTLKSKQNQEAIERKITETKMK